MIFSADIEDWQQSVFDFDRAVSNRVVANTERLLELLALHQVTGTFFVQGMVAEKFPALIQKIAMSGHELASHAYSHRPLFSLTPTQFALELQQSITPLEQVSGQKVIGFRAPTFSIREPMLDWYCATLLEHGIRYDSSIVLVKNNFSIRNSYGFNDARIIQAIQSRGLDCYPLSVGKILGKRLPVMGGGYFRLFPYWLTRWMARDIDPDSSVFYMHPYELDTHEYHDLHKELAIPLKTAFHQFSARHTVARKLGKLFNNYHFNSFAGHYYAAPTYG